MYWVCKEVVLLFISWQCVLQALTRGLSTFPVQQMLPSFNRTKETITRPKHQKCCRLDHLAAY